MNCVIKYFITVAVHCLVVVDAIIALILAILYLEDIAKKIAKKVYKNNYAEIGISFPNKH